MSRTPAMLASPHTLLLGSLLLLATGCGASSNGGGDGGQGSGPDSGMDAGHSGGSDAGVPPADAGAPDAGPDCSREAANFCASTRGYPFIRCDTSNGATHGQCVIPLATPADSLIHCSSSTPCGAGDTCLTIGSGSNAQNVCVEACTGADFTNASCSTSDTQCVTGHCILIGGTSGGVCDLCPRGYVCSATSVSASYAEVCNVSPAAEYGGCDLSSQCPSGDQCIPFAPRSVDGSTPSLCLQPCGGASGACPSPMVCDTSVGACLLPCTTNSDCPMNTLCDPNLGNKCDPSVVSTPGISEADAGSAEASDGG